MIKRSLNLKKQLGKTSSAFLFGARGVGKTRLSQQCLAELKENGHHVLSYNLLHSEIYERFLKRPHQFRLEVEKQILAEKRPFVFVDEVQKVPALLDQAHSLIESHPGKVRFLMTGSSARKLKRSGANMLAGRFLNLKLHPLLQQEFEISDEQNAQLGSLPGIVVDNEKPQSSLRSYVSTYLKEEVQLEALVRQIDSFARFLEVAGQYHTEVISASNIADYAGVSSQTVAEYISILEDTLIAWRLPGWNASAKKQLRTTPKLYLFDNGVASALRGEVGIEVIESSARFGKFFEANVIQHALRINDYDELDLKFSYWRTNNDVEIDLIISRGAGRPLAAVEIKSNVNPQAKHLSNLKKFSMDYPETKLVCLCRTPHPYTLDGIEIIPFAHLPELLHGL